MAKRKKISSYLKKLKFDPKLNDSFAAKYVLNVRLMFLLIISVVVWGVFAYLNLPRRTTPEVEIPYVFISTILPGANPTDVEQLVTTPLEDAIEGVNKIDTYSSSSLENSSTIVVQFESSVDPKEARDEIQSAVDTVNLPDDAFDPRVMELDFENFPVWTFAVTSDTDLATLFRFSEELQDRLEEEGLVNKALVTGIETQEFQILIKPEVMTTLGLNPYTLQQAISAETTSYPGGAVSSGTSNYGLSIEPRINSLEELRQKQITIEGKQYVLGEIATIMQRSAPNQAKTFYVEGSEADEAVKLQRAVNFSVYKRTGADLDESAQAAKKAAQEVIQKYDGKFKLVTIVDYDEMIAQQFRDLFQDFFTSILLVFGTLLVFLGIRQATIASLVIPISFLFTFGAIHTMGLSLNFLTLFSLLLAQGMIVDDVIVIISAMTEYYGTKKFTIRQVGLLVWRDFIEPTLTSNLTNVWSFVPLLLTTGIMGEFIKSIPLVVTVALVGSTAISLLVTIPLMIIILKPEIPKRVQLLLKVLGVLLVLAAIFGFLSGNKLAPLAVLALIIFSLISYWVGKEVLAQIKLTLGTRLIKLPKLNWLDKIQTGFLTVEPLVLIYKKVLSKILASKYRLRQTIAMVVIFSLFSYALVPLGFVKNEFFPKTDQENLYVGVNLPVGTSIEETTLEAEELLQELKKTPEIEYVTAEVGSSTDASFVAASSGVESHKIRFSLKLPPQEERHQTSIKIAADLREKYQNYNKGDFFVTEESEGPPAGEDLQITLTGPELEVLEEKALKVKKYLDNLEGVVDAEVSTKPGVGKLSFVPDQNQLQQAGISVGQIGMYMRTFASGFKLDELRFDNDDKIDLTLRINNDLSSPEELSVLTIPNRDDDPLPLLSLGQFELVASPTKITHEDGKRSITVSAAVEAGYQVPERGKKLEEFAETDLNLPSGYSWQTGGANEENQKSVNSLIQAMGIAAMLIAATMVIQLQSFRKAAVVMLVIPLAISGVYILFSLTGTPISFPALVGIIALFGIVVKNSILIVDKINANIEIGLPFREAVADGASSRLEPIIFSSITNFIGLLPITISDPLWRGLGGAIISGLMFSGIIMLFFIPVVYYVWYENQYQDNL